MFDILEIESDAVMTCRPTGIFDIELAQKIVKFVEIKEVELENGFNRFCDMTCLDGIQLSFVELLGLATRRADFNPNDIRVKSAFLADHPVVSGIATMYQHMLASPRIEVRIFDQLETAAEWLAVNPDRLRSGP